MNQPLQRNLALVNDLFKSKVVKKEHCKLYDRYVFIILIKFLSKKLRAVKVAQLNFLSENLKEIFPIAVSRPEVRHRIKPGYCRPLIGLVFTLGTLRNNFCIATKH